VAADKRTMGAPGNSTSALGIIVHLFRGLAHPASAGIGKAASKSPCRARVPSAGFCVGQAIFRPWKSIREHC
jgi:hypothetical protein